MLHPLPRRRSLLALLVLGLLLAPAVWPHGAAAQTGGPGNPTLIGPADGATGQYNPVVLRWNSAVNAVAYDVAYLDSTVSSTYSYSGSLTGTSYTLPTMPDGHLIYWEVFACDYTACSGQSPLWSFSMNAPAPGAPSPVSPNNVSGTGTTPTLSWSQPSGVIAGVTVYSATVADGDTGATMGTTAYSAALSAAVPASFNLIYGQSYTWNVQACNAGACSGYGPTWPAFSTANAPAPPPLSSPNNVSGIGTTPTLSWGASSDAVAGVTTYYAGVFDGDTDATMGITAATTGTSATVPASFALIMGKSYTWNVYACNDWACSNWGTQWFPFSTANAPAAPAPVSPNNVNNTGTTPTLSWSQPSGAYAGVTLYSAGVFDGDTGTLMGTTAYTTALSVAVPAGFNLVYGKSYTWNVQACNDWPCSGWGPTWAPFTTAPPPDRPGESAPLNYATAEGTTPTVSWAAPTNSISGLTIYTVGVWLLNWQDGTSTALPALSAGTSLSAAIPSNEGLVAGLSYFWAVYGCNDRTCGDWSASEWLFSTAPAPSAAVQTAPADGATNTGTTVTLTWNASTQNNNPAPGQTHYYVDVYDQNTGQFVQQNVSTGTNTSDALPNLTSGDVYRWIVTACNGADTEQDCTLTLSTAGPIDYWPYFSTAATTSPHPWPGVTTSVYIQSTSLTGAYQLGCNRAQAQQAYPLSDSVVILAFGDPYVLGTRPDGTPLYGTLLPAIGVPISVDDIEQITDSFVDGWAHCQGQTAHFVIGTTNYEDMSTNNPNAPASLTSCLHQCYVSAGHADAWADLVQRVNSYLVANYTSYIAIGGIDAEPGFASPSYQSTDPAYSGNRYGALPWISEFVAPTFAPPRILYDFGSCDGCTTDASGINCSESGCTVVNEIGINHGWNLSDVYTAAFALDHGIVIPEIYRTDEVQAWQWIHVALYGYSFTGTPLTISGVLTECVATAQQSGDPLFGNKPQVGWTQMDARLTTPAWLPYLQTTAMSYSTDIAYQSTSAPGQLKSPTGSCY